jgi:hypothetical protein
MISQASLNEFKEIYKQRFKKEISDAEALKLATNLINLYKTVYLTQNNKLNQTNKSKNLNTIENYDNR